jgi:hypothetical protein
MSQFAGEDREQRKLSGKVGDRTLSRATAAIQPVEALAT